MNNRDEHEYLKKFVQPFPRYGIKRSNSEWRSRSGMVSQWHIKRHLNQQLWIASLPKWYPALGVIDFDNKDDHFIAEIRDKLALNEGNSMLFTSESPSSYHLLFKPVYNSRPPTLRLFHESFEAFADEQSIEVFPAPGTMIRLPFGRGQYPVDASYWLLSDWKEYQYWFEKLDEYDLGLIPFHQQPLPFVYPHSELSGDYYKGEYLFQNGLIEPNSRHEAQFLVLYFLWRQNTDIDVAKEVVFKWIRKKHNGLSKDVANTRQVRGEIARQAAYIWSKYAYPDYTHNTYLGYVCKPDIERIFKVCRGSLPRSRFLFNLVKFCYPRRYRTRIRIHSDHLVEWGSKRTYLKYLEELERANVLIRSSGYIISRFAKEIRLNWEYGNADDAIMVDGRAPDTLEETIKACFEAREYRGLLDASGVDRGHLARYVRAVFDGASPNPSPMSP